MQAAISFANVSKRYRLVSQRPFLAKEIVRRVLQRPSSVESFSALTDVSFTVSPGESIGVIGTNGSGKSTLLALIARTSYPSSGHVAIHGRVGPLLELGAGFHPDLTGYENIMLNASLLGLSRREVDARLDAIIDYSGIRPFIHAPIQTYSTGMKARLGFAVVAHIDPDILLIDEVLAVGDVEYQARCQRTMQEFRRRGKTLFLVSHDLEAVRALCQRVLWLHKGTLRASGDAQTVCARYTEFWAEGK